MSTSHKEKIIRVLQLFQTTDEKTPMNAVQISQKLEEEYGMENVHRTSIYDDVRLLQSCGYPIKQAENSHKGWYMEKHLLEDWEIKLMLDSVQQARCVSVHEANEIRNKLLNLTSQRGRSRFSHMIMPLPGNVRGVGQIGEYIEIMLEAMYLHKKIRFQYTEINNATGRRTDRTDYPITAVREAIINALVHRDYSIHTEGMPIQLIMFEDRIEIHNPGGLYGRITIDQLGKIQPDTRNPVLASALETLGITENRYSGIPTIRMEMEKYNLRQPEFLDERGSFIVKLYKESKNDYEDMSNDEETNNLIVFCKTPRTRKEICDYLGLNSVTYAIQTYVNPLVEAGVIKLSIPDKPKSPKQLYYSVEREE